MRGEWLWTPTPAFLAMLRALPGKEEHQVLEKLKILEMDPSPDGNTKKKIKDMEQLLDYIFPPSLAQVMQQPVFLVEDLDDLIRYKEGELIGFLLKLSPEQERFVSWALKATGPTQVKGGPGTGKSTVALYRVRSLIEKLRSQGVSEPRILFTTYTNALVHFSEQLLQQLLGEDACYVEVQTADKKMSDILTRAGVPRNQPFLHYR